MALPQPQLTTKPNGRFHQENPQIYRLVEHFANEVIARGYKHYSINSIFERIRWHSQVETRDLDFKLSNSHRPYYARHFMNQNPQHDGFFRTRPVANDNWELADAGS